LDLKQLLMEIQKEPIQGEALGKDCFKIRMAIESKNKGKSGGARLIICVKLSYKKITLLSIYDKSNQSDINAKILLQLLKESNLL
jgi:hypothetical protein